MAMKRFHGSCWLMYGANGPLSRSATRQLITSEPSEASCQAIPFHAPKTVVRMSTANINRSYGWRPILSTC